MWTSSFGYVLSLWCNELHSISQRIVGIGIVWDHVNEIRDAAYIISSRNEVYALKLLNVT